MNGNPGTLILPVDYFNSTESLISLHWHFELFAVNGLSRRHDIFAYPIADNVDVSRRLFVVSFRLTGKWPEYDRMYAVANMMVAVSKRQWERESM